VADRNRRLQFFLSDGTFQREWPVSGWEEFYTEPYIAISGDDIFVTDSYVHHFARYNDGKLTGLWGKSGNGSGDFNRPIGIAVASPTTVYVAAIFNNRIQKPSCLVAGEGAASALCLLPRSPWARGCSAAPAGRKAGKRGRAEAGRRSPVNWRTTIAAAVLIAATGRPSFCTPRSGGAGAASCPDSPPWAVLLLGDYVAHPSARPWVCIRPGSSGALLLEQARETLYAARRGAFAVATGSGPAEACRAGSSARSGRAPSSMPPAHRTKRPPRLGTLAPGVLIVGAGEAACGVRAHPANRISLRPVAFVDDDR
jgi:hypothetical protein